MPIKPTTYITIAMLMVVDMYDVLVRQFEYLASFDAIKLKYVRRQRVGPFDVIKLQNSDVEKCYLL